GWPALVLRLRADALDAEDPGPLEAGDHQGDRARGAFLVPLGGDGDAGARPDPRADERLPRPGTHAEEAVYVHRHRRLARRHHVVQRLVPDLAEPEEGAWHGHRQPG